MRSPTPVPAAKSRADAVLGRELTAVRRALLRRHRRFSCGVTASLQRQGGLQDASSVLLPSLRADQRTEPQSLVGCLEERLMQSLANLPN